MSEPRLIETRPVALDEIDASKRLRAVSEAGVEAIVASIQQTGVMKDEIILRRMKGKGAPFRLVAGGHRMAAAAAMDWDEIPAKIFDCDAAWAELMEVDDNLAHAELSPLELATFLAKRKELYILAHPDTAQGKAGAAARWEDANETVSFASMIAEKRGVSRRKVELYSAIGEALDPKIAAQIAPLNPGFSVLKDLANLDVPDQQRVTLRLLDGSATKVGDALRLINDDPAPVPATPEDAAYERVMGAWGRAPMAARRRILDELWAEEPGLMAEAADAAAKADAA